MLLMCYLAVRALTLECVYIQLVNPNRKNQTKPDPFFQQFTKHAVL